MSDDGTPMDGPDGCYVRAEVELEDMGNGLIRYRSDKGFTGTFSARFYMLLFCQALSCPECGQDFGDMDEYGILVDETGNPKVQCLLCDLTLNWDKKTETLVS